jgi:hypothetical protein
LRIFNINIFPIFHTRKTQQIAFLLWPLHIFHKHAIFESLFEFLFFHFFHCAFLCVMLCLNILIYNFIFHVIFIGIDFIFTSIKITFSFWLHFIFQQILHSMEEKSQTNVNFNNIVNLDFNCLIYSMNIK